ncbi:fumarate hydratase [Bacteroides reticulotermitis JCM 10512]|uniref:Fumarate hydratase class I n=1 Tax=Bacteroides reticulotermitis JCM 10512 TaxID=1445607 RepID=W4UXB0_9BACE|nr:fumarate hydratase [Bacteroides reticulotermitis JCM 10512]
MATPPFKYQPMFEKGQDTTEYYLLTKDHVSVSEFEGKPILKIAKEGLTEMANTAFRDVSFLLRRAHNEQVAKILSDPEASENDKYVALTFLRNAEVAAKGVLPFCQDTGTAIIHGEKGQQVWTGYCDEEALSLGVYKTYTEENLRYSQNAPLNMFDEVNTKCNLPAQIDLEATEGMEYEFLCVTKGGGSANKTYLYQETKAILNPGTLVPFLVEKMKTLGTAACPPYHIAFVIGGTSAEKNLLTVKLASTHFYDNLPTTGNEFGRAFRDVELEKEVLEEAQKIGLGAQFGGKYLAHDVRIIRLPRHGASCPVGLGVSCSADRNIKCKINKEGIWIEKLDSNPGNLIPVELRQAGEGDAVKIDLNRPMAEILKELSKYPVATRLSLNGTIIVGRDIAHAKLKERLDRGEDLPQYIKDHPIYYAGPAKTPNGMACGSMGPTTAGRMDSYVGLFQSHGGSMIMLAKGNRSQQVTDACQQYGGFYLGSIGGPAALLAQDNIKSIECVEYPELGMEAIWKIEVEDFPAFILVDDKAMTSSNRLSRVARLNKTTLYTKLGGSYKSSCPPFI